MSDPDPVARSATRHLRLRTAAVVVRLLELLDDAETRGIVHHDDVERRLPFLDRYRDHLDELAGDVGSARDPATFENLAAAGPAEPPPPLIRLADSGIAGDPAVAVDVVVTAALAERDPRFGDLIGLLQAPAAFRRPCIGLLATLLGREPDEIAGAVAALVRAGILDLENPGDPRAEQVVRLPGPVLAVIEGGRPSAPAMEYTTLAEAPAPAGLVLPAEVAERARRAGALMRDGELDVLVLRGRAGTGRRSTLRAVAAGHGRGLLIAAPADGPAGADPLPGSLALLLGAMLAWSVEPGIGQLAVVHRPPGAGPVGVAIGRHGAVSVTDGDRAAVIDLPMPDAGQRRRFWTAAGLAADAPVLATVSDRYVLSGGTIGRVAAQAGAIARIDGRARVTVGDVRQAAQDSGRQRLESLATLLPPLAADFAPVLGGPAAQEYAALLLRSRHREKLGASVAGIAGGQAGRGVRALLSGPSGTGKTMAARALGVALELDVYRADLAALVDKYIGETERRLDELFTRAEDLDVVLLIDEGDALMTRRTEVRSSNDRYANLETDYLLQRLESYEGIVLITTNAPHLVDTAFQRRLDVTVPFVPPGPDERRRIWRLHLPERHAVTPALLDTLAVRCRLTGGQIRNAAIHAVLLALDAGRTVDDAVLIVAVERELAAAGQTSPLTAGPVPLSPFERAGAAP